MASSTGDQREYTPEKLRKTLTSRSAIQQARKEYSRMRRNALRRLETMKRAGYAGTETYRQNIDKYRSLRDLRNDSAAAEELIHLLPQLEDFLSSKLGTVRGIREVNKKALTSLHEHGYTFIEEKNLQDFGEFMEWARSHGYDKAFGSPRLYEVYVGQTFDKDAKELEEEFKKWQKKKNRAARAKKPKKKENATAKDYRARWKL